LERERFLEWMKASRDVQDLVGEEDQSEKDKKAREEHLLDQAIRRHEMSRF
jgi:hypothetical protein